MVPTDTSEADMLVRYMRAVSHTPVRWAARTAGNSLEGYWFDDHRFYFMSERLDAETGRVRSTPSVADAWTGKVAALIELEALAGLLSGRGVGCIGPADLADAEFDVPDAEHLVVSLKDLAFHVDLNPPALTRVENVVQLPQLYAPNGRYAVFVAGHDLKLRDRLSGDVRALTDGGVEGFAYGRDSEANLAVISDRQRPAPIGLWSRDSEWFLTQRVDERTVPSLSLLQHVPPGGGRPILHSYRYPMPGDPRPLINFVAIHIETGRVVTTDRYPTFHQIFSPFAQRWIWFSEDSQAFYFLRLNREQSEAQLIEVGLMTGASRVVISETAAAGYIDLHPLISAQPNVRVLRASNEFIWFSERDGWGHLYLHDLSTGALKTQITSGDWVVRDIVHVDEVERRILFLAGGLQSHGDPGRRALYAINLEGGTPELVIEHAGEVAVSPSWPGGIRQNRPYMPPYAQMGVSPSGAFVAARRSSLHQPTRLTLVGTRSAVEVSVAEAESHANPVTPPRPFVVTAADGETALYGALFLPADFDDGRSYPVVDLIYPGPQVARLPRSFRTRNEALAQSLAELGFVTVLLDSRGMPFRSRAFHQAGRGSLLEPQLADHAEAMAQLCARYPFMDLERVGMLGWSGGGSATARALFDYPDVFKVGVAGCGNHDNRLYQAAWLEKYAGPRKNGYWDEQSNVTRAAGLRGKLFLITGDMDDNVHPAQTMALADALIKANRDFDMLTVPNAAHDLATNPYVLRRAWDYFVRYLLGVSPPAGFEIRYSAEDLSAAARVAGRQPYSA